MSSRVPWLGCSLVLLGMTAAPGAQAPNAGERLRLHTSRFGLRSPQVDPPSIVSLDATGVERRALPLDGWQPRFGPGEMLALVEADPPGAERAVRILGADLEERAGFSVPRDRELAIGTASLALFPRVEHGAGTAFDLEYRDLGGSRTGAAARSDLTLVEVEPSATGQWVVHSVDRTGEFHLFLFDARGEERWEHAVRSRVRPVVELAPAGDLAAIGVLQDDLRHSTLSWIDAGGKITGSLAVPAFRTACFDPTGRRLALGGGNTVALVSAGESELLWSRGTAGDLALGRPLSFSRRGDELRAIVTVGGDPAPVDVAPTLVRFEDLEGAVRTTEELLDSVPKGPRPWVIELLQGEAGEWHLVTKTGLWRL